MSESLFRGSRQLPQNAKASRRSTEATVGNTEAERQFRHAALNLLEDAIRARSETAAINRQLEDRIAEHERSKNALIDTQQKLNEATRSFEKLKTEFDERVRERTKELEQRERRLQESAAQIKKTELRDRKRLARLLHDQVQQLLIAVKMRVSLMADDLGIPEISPINEVMSLLDDAVNVTRDVSVQLAPPLLHDEGLPAAMEWLVSRTMQQFRLTITAHIDPLADPASQEGRDILFQAAQEFLLNAAKHAHCKKVKLRLSHTRKQTTLKVSDGGSGFDVAELQNNGSFGLFEVQERLKSIGGKLQIDSKSGKGTCAMAVVPIFQADRANQGRALTKDCPLEETVQAIRDVAETTDGDDNVRVDRHQSHH